MRLKDAFWIWGHPTNSLKGAFGLTADSDVSPADGMRLLGASNIWFVPMRNPVDPEAEYASAPDALHLGRSLEHARDVDDVADAAARYPNLDRAIFDDFFNEENTETNYAAYPPERLRAVRETLHAAGAELWIVLYTLQFARTDLRAYLDEADGVSLWFWEEKDVANYEARVRRFFELTPQKKRMLGCYLYDFGGQKSADPAAVLTQLDRGADFLRAGSIEGVILHTNAVCGMGHPAPRAARDWLARHGDEIL